MRLLDHGPVVSKLNQRVTGGGGDAAVIVSVASHLDVALVSPGGTPRVLHQPIVLTVLIGTETHGQHSMVQLLGAAVLVKVDALRIELERFLGCVNGHRHGAHGGQRLCQLGLIALRNINSALVRGTAILRVVAALVVDSLVRIGLLGVDSLVVLDVLEGLVH